MIKMDRALFGAAYYDEYMPEERLEADIALMKRASVSVVRIGESTWSTIERADGVFDFGSLDRVVVAMGKAGIGVIIGTATYAFPAWLARKHPEILAETGAGRRKFGPRQNMDILNLDFRRYAERVIRQVASRYAGDGAVIGFQADNETKHYGCVGAAWQKAFVEDLRYRFGTTDALNKAFGLDYWSNRIDDWADFPPVEGTINASVSSAYARFQRKVVSDYLAWQVGILNEYKRPDQFVTHNFDFEWRGYSFGVQPDVDHAEASRAFDVVGIDVYHPSQANLTGREIAFCGDLARSLKGAPYLVMETQAQGFPEWLPFPGQLRLQALSHLASGAAMVEYWHWHSIHNSIETYWKGLLSHDLGSNRTYEEAVTIGGDLARLGDRILLASKANKVALLVSNEALTAFDSFKHVFGLSYNDVVRRVYDALYELNVECDVVFANGDRDFAAYGVVVVPALYAATDRLLERLRDYVAAGGNIIVSFMSGFCDENAKVRHCPQPGLIGEALQVCVRQFTKGQGVPLVPAEALGVEALGGSGPENRVEGFFELVEPEGASVIARYGDPHWSGYAAVTESRNGKGRAAYIGCMASPALMREIVRRLLSDFGAFDVGHSPVFPIVRRRGLSPRGRRLTYYLNYSDEPGCVEHAGRRGVEILGDSPVAAGEQLGIGPWGALIVEEDGE
jgi:beta-galactosidase